MLDFAGKWTDGLEYQAFLERHGTDDHRRRWAASLEAIELTPGQRQLLAGFQREMRVLVLAGAWCGDCVAQCPAFERFAQASDRITVRYFDRDAHPDLGAELKICGATRVPHVVFADEEGIECGRRGDRTLAKYRQMGAELTGAACATGIVIGRDPLLEAVVAEWLGEFERIQWMLRTSARLRQKHGD
jgi:thiol-disulfide isomerase/thioredoxin